MTTYGIGYMGSKNKIAKDIIDFLPEGERLENQQSITNLECTCNSYKEYKYLDGDIIYCDIPYENTKEYIHKFDHKEFYD